MSYQHLKTIEVKSTKKKHFCHGCLTKFPVGSNLIYSAGKFEGEFCQCYWCKACDAYLTKYVTHFVEGVEEGDFLQMENYKEFKNQFENKINDCIK